MSKIAQWNTEFDTANNVITHSFDKEVKVINNLNFKKITVFRGEKKVSETEYEENESIKDYFDYLLEVERQVEEIRP